MDGRKVARWTVTLIADPSAPTPFTITPQSAPTDARGTSVRIPTRMTGGTTLASVAACTTAWESGLGAAAAPPRVGIDRQLAATPAVTARAAATALNLESDGRLTSPAALRCSRSRPAW